MVRIVHLLIHLSPVEGDEFFGSAVELLLQEPHVDTIVDMMIQKT
jgi:hypothetical protein